jgi:hypothetical protein
MRMAHAPSQNGYRRANQEQRHARGLVENIYARNITVGQVANAGVAIDFYYEEGEAGKFTPIVRHVDIRGLKLQKAKYTLYLRAFKNAPIEDVRLYDGDFGEVAMPNLIENGRA